MFYIESYKSCERDWDETHAGGHVLGGLKVLSKDWDGLLWKYKLRDNLMAREIVMTTSYELESLEGLGKYAPITCTIPCHDMAGNEILEEYTLRTLSDLSYLEALREGSVFNKTVEAVSQVVKDAVQAWKVTPRTRRRHSAYIDMFSALMKVLVNLPGCSTSYSWKKSKFKSA